MRKLCPEKAFAPLNYTFSLRNRFYPISFFIANRPFNSVYRKTRGLLGFQRIEHLLTTKLGDLVMGLFVTEIARPVLLINMRKLVLFSGYESILWAACRNTLPMLVLRKKVGAPTKLCADLQFEMRGFASSRKFFDFGVMAFGLTTPRPQLPRVC